jgi:hypothetical protein
MRFQSVIFMVDQNNFRIVSVVDIDFDANAYSIILLSYYAMWRKVLRQVKTCDSSLNFSQVICCIVILLCKFYNRPRRRNFWILH